MYLPFTPGRSKRFQLNGDIALFREIVKDTIINSGQLAPNDHWLFVDSEPRVRHQLLEAECFDQYFRSYSNLYSLLYPWIGSGKEGATSEDIEKYAKVLNFSSEFTDYIRTLSELQQHEETILRSDFASLMDVCLISKFFNFEDDKSSRILEIGPGYGRLVEALITFCEAKGASRPKFFLIDAVPVSLMYSFLYLKSAFSELSIGASFKGDKIEDWENFDIFISPPWKAMEMKGIFDISINVESMQEMTPAQVGFYISKIDDLTKTRGTIYLSNSRNRVFTGNWNYPNTWQQLFSFQTPRSWSCSHPTEVFYKNDKAPPPQWTDGFKAHTESMMKKKQIQVDEAHRNAEFWKQSYEKLAPQLEQKQALVDEAHRNAEFWRLSYEKLAPQLKQKQALVDEAYRNAEFWKQAYEKLAPQLEQKQVLVDEAHRNAEFGSNLTRR